MATSTKCVFCGVYQSHRYYLCAQCQRQYDRELGAGWDTQEWFKELVKLHRKQTSADAKETARTVQYSELVTPTGEPAVHRFQPNSETLDALVLSYANQGFGAKKIMQLIRAQGWEIARDTVDVRLARLRAAGILPKREVWSRKPLTEAEKAAAIAAV